MINIINWFLALIKSHFAIIDIENIEFICNWCENNDVDCSVVGHTDGVIVVYVRTCQECGGVSVRDPEGLGGAYHRHTNLPNGR